MKTLISLTLTAMIGLACMSAQADPDRYRPESMDKEGMPRKEGMAMKDKMHKKDGMGMGMGMKMEMKKMDTNGDGMISKEEFMSHQEAMWDRLKKNSDGMVSITDMEMAHDAMMKH